MAAASALSEVIDERTQFGRCPSISLVQPSLDSLATFSDKPALAEEAGMEPAAEGIGMRRAEIGGLGFGMHDINRLSQSGEVIGKIIVRQDLWAVKTVGSHLLDGIKALICGHPAS